MVIICLYICRYCCNSGMSTFVDVRNALIAKKVTVEQFRFVDKARSSESAISKSNEFFKRKVNSLHGIEGYKRSDSG